MIVASARGGPDGKRQIILLGLSDENIRMLTEGYPVRIKSETHEGFPIKDTTFLIIHGKTEADLENTLRTAGVVDEQTQIIRQEMP